MDSNHCIPFYSQPGGGPKKKKKRPLSSEIIVQESDDSDLDEQIFEKVKTFESSGIQSSINILCTESMPWKYFFVP